MIISSKLFYTETKLHFAHTIKIITDNATGKNWMSLQNFLSGARQFWVYIIAKERKLILTHKQYQSFWKKNK